jgi:hypothetical protein
LNILGENHFKGVKKTIPEGPLANKCNMCWNVSLKELKESLKSWFSS